MDKGFTSEVRDTAMIIRFDRPKIRNPLSTPVLDALAEALGSVGASEGIKKIIFTGSNGVFASGADLWEIAALPPQMAAKFATRGQELMARIVALPQTTIAVINGYCLGGALDLALSCERRIASNHAVFCHPGTGLGIITGWGGTQRLPRLVGSALALEIFFTAKRIDAAEALRIGLIDEISADPLAAAMNSV